MGFDNSLFFSGPHFHVDLASIDARHPVHYARRLLIFRCRDSDQQDEQLDAFKVGVQALVNRCPILGGIVTNLPEEEAKHGKEDWRTIVPDNGIELVVKDLSSELPSFEELEAVGFPPSELPYNLLVPVPADINHHHPFAACKMQFSTIKGGIIITFAISHCVADGSGHNELIRLLSDDTRQAQSNQYDAGKPTQIGLDRQFLRNTTSVIPFNISDHPGFTWDAAPPKGATEIENTHLQAFEATPEAPILLRIRREHLAQLKADATVANSPPISTHDALSALVWQTLLRIRSHRGGVSSDLVASTRGQFYMPSDARHHLSMSPLYIGNVIYQLTTSLELGTLLSPSGLPQAASAIRRAIKTVTPDLVRSYVAMANEKWVQWSFLRTASTTGVAMGTDWTSGELYRHDWGPAFGPLVSYRYPGGEGQVFNCIFPRLLDGGAEVVVSVLPGEVAMLKGSEGFGEYLD